MKRMFGLILTAALLASLCGCAGAGFSFSDSYEEWHSTETEDSALQSTSMAGDLAVISEEEDAASTDHSDDYAELLVNDSTKEVVQSYHCFEKVYPASITKIMTALLTLESGKMDDEITLDHNIILSEDGAVVSTLSEGDTVSVEQVFNTMLVKSANDCAVILAEYLAGSEDAFAERMNEKAKEIGATHTHFVNSNGLHDDDHYTTAYDLYLIFKQAVQYERFVDTISQKDYTMTYTDEKGQEVTEYMTSTNHYLTNEYPVPVDVTMYGGKTGTTSEAGSCLILMTENEKDERFFSIVLGSETKDDLYHSMTALLEKTN